jgi:hypothetical protein
MNGGKLVLVLWQLYKDPSGPRSLLFKNIVISGAITLLPEVKILPASA